MQASAGVFDQERNLRETKAAIISSAIARAGSVAALARLAGLRRCSVSLWARGAVIPSDANLAKVLSWIGDADKKRTLPG